ncbi:hypothetical protein P6F26_06500 [Roseibacterium sp. SDUM158017]|uniref:hypothetical protein n=1 Tax=Roseicyclus salinarum TaxID=3036773 RepID=UPI002414E374|nr:hypothetical protein [Roseibacterium sp. SDUM158017]MDG4648086.1 hypothetical protein [Roseibacterium sp. SDUM158017]
MDSTFQHEARPGNLPLSLFALAGLILLAAQLWAIMPGFVMLIFIPALLVSIAQLIVTPVYRLRMADDAWRIEAGAEARDFPSADIAYLRIVDRGPHPRGFVVLSDGSETEMPRDLVPDPLILIREATRRGIPVRQD